MSRKSIIEVDRISEILEDSWMGLGEVCGDDLFNPLENIPETLSSEPHIYILWLFQNPDYFSLFVKEIFN